ncbi:MAG: hypothetical protein KDA44_18990 [Planctomycetales bacterium]|nr:hypothetical protein [Planctomycetales bacterium]
MPRSLGYVVVVLLALSNASTARRAAAVDSVWAYQGATGRMLYVPDAQGDRIMDFSGVGYRGRGVELIPPDVPTVTTVGPVAGDDTTTIQAAIDYVSNLPLGPDGFRGAVQLTAGDFDIATQLDISASGVVLRGVGRDAGGGTVLHARGTSQRALINVGGSGSQSLIGSTRNMIDKTVPVGATSFRVDSTVGFAVGDTVRVERPSTANWISDLGMDMIPPRSDGGTVQQWQPGTLNIRFDRVITRIEGNRIFLDAPLANAFEQRYGGGTIKRYSWNGRIENVGVENLRAESDFASDTDENHAWDFVSISAAQDVWVRGTTSAYFAGSAVVSNPSAKWVTVDDAVNLDPKSQITGERRYTFDLSGQLDFVTNSEANSGRHDFVNNSTRPPGPHVFHRSVAHNALDESGPHQRWATGSLFDNIVIEGDQINVRNRGNFGTGHGWAGANMVVWNSTADSFIIQNPPTAQNWLVGSTGALVNDATFGPQPLGYVDSLNQPVAVESLYEAQLADSADIREMHWTAPDGDWTAPGSWQAGLAPGVYTVAHRDYLVGDIDGFAYDGVTSVDNPAIDSAWASYVATSTGQPIVGFDDIAGGTSVAFTITHVLDPGERVINGSLALSMKTGGGLATDDFVRLFDGDPSHQQTFAALGWSGSVNSTDAFVGLLDLGNNLASLQSGAVNVQVSGDTGVDWAIYQVSVAKAIGDASGAAAVIDNNGTARIGTDVGTVGALVVGSDMTGGMLSLDSLGRLDVAGPLVLNSTGTLQFEINASGQAGEIHVSGAAALAGALSVTLADGYAPVPGDQFTLLTAGGGLIGAFANAQLPAAPADGVWELGTDGFSLFIELFQSADFNLDRSVDRQDLSAWTTSFGMEEAAHEDGDANGDGLVDGDDFLAWQRQFGPTFASTVNASGSMRVPEPSAEWISGLLAAVLPTAAGMRRRWSKQTQISQFSRRQRGLQWNSRANER